MMTQNEKKRTYVKPSMEVYLIEKHNKLLQTSMRVYSDTTDPTTEEQW